MKNEEIVIKALQILESQLRTKGVQIQNAEDAKSFLKLQLASLEREVFGVMFLDGQHQMIEFDIMFQGTIDSASVYPREVAKKALQVNAAALIMSHNHPSGVAEPSQADRMITEDIKKALALFDIRTLDHIIVGGMSTYSFAEHGLL